MSLKAKLEAVIYAAEEPVTLAQLALLFTADALEWKAEQDAAAAAAQAAQAETAAGGGETLPLIDETVVSLEPDGNAAETGAAEGSGEIQGGGAAPEAAVEEGLAEQGTEAAAAATDAGAAPEETVASAGSGAEAAAETSAAAGAEAGMVAPAEAGQAEAPDAESELKREARQRDRDVRNVLRRLLDELIVEYTADERGIEIREVAGGYRMATKPECHDAVRGFVKSLKPALKLSLPALETLAVIAYKQPVTAPEVNEIRGVDSSGVFGSLLSRKLIATAGRKQVVGRPILYKTTREFLLRFGLKDVSELPSMEEFEKLAASELEEPETAQTEDELGTESGVEQIPELEETISREPEANDEASNPIEPQAETQEAAIEKVAAPAEPGEAAEAEPAETEQVPHD